MKNDFVSVPVTLGSDVANAGTFTVPYPSGYNAGDFSNATGHYLSLNGDKLQQPKHITLSFGASAVTVTNGTGGTLPAGSKGFFQFESLGMLIAKQALASGNKPVRVYAQELYSVLIDFGAPVAADADGILNDASATDSAQSYTVADFATTYTGQLDVARNLTATGTAGSNHVITVTGEDEYGQTIVEALTLNGTNVIAGVKAFKKVTTVAVAAGAAGDTFDLGWGDVLGLPIRLNSILEVSREFVAGVPIAVRADYTRIPFQLTEAEGDAGGSFYVATGFAGNVVDAGLVVENTVTTGGGITFEIANAAVDGLTLTISDGATAGTQVTDTATAGHASRAFTATQPIEIVVPSAVNAGAPINGFIGVEKTALSQGTLVAGLAKNTAATSTNADVRGTYDPTTACDGTTSFALWVLTPELDIGNRQYAG